MNKPTAKEILAEWLHKAKDKTITSFNIEIRVPEYGWFKYGIKHTGGTYLRIFRELRDGVDKTKIDGLQIDKIANNGKIYDEWRIS